MKLTELPENFLKFKYAVEYMNLYDLLEYEFPDYILFIPYENNVEFIDPDDHSLNNIESIFVDYGGVSFFSFDVKTGNYTKYTKEIKKIEISEDEIDVIIDNGYYKEVL